VIGVPSRLRLIRKTVVLVRIFPHFDFRIEENTARFRVEENAARRKWKYDDPKFDCAECDCALNMIVCLFIMNQ
jgi:hypothetical protein